MKKYTKAQSKTFTKGAKALLFSLVTDIVEEKDTYPYYKAKLVTEKGTEFRVTLWEPDSGYSHSVFFISPNRAIHKQNFHALDNGPEIALKYFEAHLDYILNL